MRRSLRGSVFAIRKLFVRGFDRPNIFLRVDTFQTEDEKMSGLIRRIRFAEKPGIVYVATRKNAETIMGDCRRRVFPRLSIMRV